MTKLITQFNSFLEQYNVLVAVIVLILLVWGIYNKIKYLCLQKASEMVSKAEGYENLTGEEKLAMCIIWIEEELPKLFRNSLIQTLIEKLINYVYDNSFEFMKKYVKRKTGYDISSIIEQVKGNVTSGEQKAEE